MPKLNNLIGKRYGQLTIMKLHPERTNTGFAQWICKCDCGNTTVVIGINLVRGNTKSCGCAQYIRKK